MKYKYSILTFIIGKNYQKVHQIKYKQDDVQYLLITDDNELKSNTWKVIYDESLLNISSNWNRCWNIRYNLFKYCKTNICVRIDGSIQIKKSLDPIINKFLEGNYDIGVAPHQCRYNIIEQLNAWKGDRYSQQNIDNQLQFFKKSHYNFDYKGLIGFTFSIHKNTKIQKQIVNLTYYFLSYLSKDLYKFERLDQTIFTYVLNTYFSHLNVFPLSLQMINSDTMQWYLHNSNIPNMIFDLGRYNIYNKDKKYLFNKLVQCYYIYNNECKTQF